MPITQNLFYCKVTHLVILWKIFFSLEQWSYVRGHYLVWHHSRHLYSTAIHCLKSSGIKIWPKCNLLKLVVKFCLSNWAIWSINKKIISWCMPRMVFYWLKYLILTTYFPYKQAYIHSGYTCISLFSMHSKNLAKHWKNRSWSNQSVNVTWLLLKLQCIQWSTIQVFASYSMLYKLILTINYKLLSKKIDSVYNNMKMSEV